MDITKQHSGLAKWNRKIHIYLGLFFVFFMWLFGLSGLLLNHHWEFAKSWERRNENSYQTTIPISRERNKLALAHEILNELDIKASIYNIRFTSDSALLNIVAAKPGRRYDIQAQLSEGDVQIKKTELDQWNIMTALHTLRNPITEELGERSASKWASLWSFSMDIVSAGLIVICLGGWYLWLQVKRERFYYGLISLSGGFILCLYFLLF